MTHNYCHDDKEIFTIILIKIEEQHHEFGAKLIVSR